MIEIKLDQRQFVELSDQVGGSLVAIEASIGDLAFYVRDLRDAFYGGRQASFASNLPPGTEESRFCPQCQTPFRVPASLPYASKEYCSFSCRRASDAEPRKSH